VKESVTIMIVDDSAAVRRAIRLVVKDLAGQIHECEDGSKALAAYQEHLPDWVLMDIRMRETDGLTATRQIKAVFPDARIIVVTVCKGADMREAARIAGACGYVVKDNLLELRQLLKNRTCSRASHTIAS
jgi:CheY-like chemotaxis protein